MLIYKEEIRYLEIGAKFFTDDGNQDEIAWLHKSLQNFGGYADGFQTGALSLLDSSLINKDLRDDIIYPAIFLIRQYIELRLKELIQYLNYIKERSYDFKSGHDIEILWDNFKEKYSSIIESLEEERTQIVSDLINEIVSVDPNSEAFRYPIDKHGNKTQKLEYVNLAQLKETFVRLCFYFDGLADQLNHYVELIKESY